MTFVASEWVSMICASPPCPPWSMADLAPGFNRDDGLVMALLVIALAILRPRVAVIENVSGMKTHMLNGRLLSSFSPGLTSSSNGWQSWICLKSFHKGVSDLF